MVRCNPRSSNGTGKPQSTKKGATQPFHDDFYVVDRIGRKQLGVGSRDQDRNLRSPASDV